MVKGFAVTLPHGVWLDGVRHREAHLRLLTGEDEVVLQELFESLPPAQSTTELLTRSLTRLGIQSPVERAGVRALCVCDREALALHLRRLTAGDRIACLSRCPRAVCGEKMSFELGLDELLQRPYALDSEVQEATVDVESDTLRVLFRLPTGADQEATAELAKRDVPAAAELLLARCVVRVESSDGRAIEGIPPVVARELPGILAERDPQAEILINLRCPECDSPFETVFDAGAYVIQEMRDRSRHLFQEVQMLASHYHWGRNEIMSMTSRERRSHVAALEETLGLDGIG